MVKVLAAAGVMLCVIVASVTSGILFNSDGVLCAKAVET